MEYIERILDLTNVLKSRSVILLGPRQCGKSTYIKEQFKKQLKDNELLGIYNLLNQKTFLKLSRNPSLIREELMSMAYQLQSAHKEKVKNKNPLSFIQGGLVIIDEIQKLPGLLDEVHLMIEDLKIRFLLTGSSARALKRKGVNLLGGRARVRHMHPLTSFELGKHFNLEIAFDRGLIPSHYFSDMPHEDLKAYVGQYLKEEIAAEGVTRNIGGFSRFLEVAGLCSGELLNYTSVASDAQVNRQMVQSYFEILEETLLGFTLKPWTKSKKRKSIGTSKFYIYDIGVMKELRGLKTIERNSMEFGLFFEHFIFQELKAYISYNETGSNLELFYWRSTSQFEVDFILGDLAIEVKSSNHISEKHLKGLKALREEKIINNFCLVSFEDRTRIVDDFKIYPWQKFLQDLWKGKLNLMINQKSSR
jgi:predicted AAA+ superfamily ATPase